MPNLRNGLNWLGDLVQILALDRFDPQRKRFALEATTACRRLKFHSRARIPSRPLRELCPELGAPAVDSVVLPGPGNDLGDVGNYAYYHALASVVKAVQPKTILEFGTYLGVGTLTLALNAPPACRIYTVDLPDEASPDLNPTLNAIDRGHIATSRFRVGQAFLDTPFRERISQIRADSLQFQADQAVPAVDLVLVDGGHSRPVIAQDTANAFKVLSPGGVILWDDYFHLYPDVVQFLDELGDRYPLHGIQGTNLVLYRSRGTSSPGKGSTP